MSPHLDKGGVTGRPTVRDEWQVDRSAITVILIEGVDDHFILQDTYTSLHMKRVP